MSDLCGGCGKEVTGQVLEAMGKKWHPACFICSECSGPLEGGFGVKDGKPICKACCGQPAGGGGGAPPGKPCGRCGKPLSGSCINALGKTFHTECFTCFGCEGDISGGFVNINDEPFCKDCAASRRPKPEAQALDPSKLCAKCGKPLSGSCLSSGGKIFHADCFRCAICDCPLAGKGAKLINEEVCCQDCALKLMPKAKQAVTNPCFICKKELSGSCVKAMGKTLHKECFMCVMCKGNLAGGFLYDEFDETVWYCKPCFPKRPGACNKCGNRLDGGQFCGNCGIKLWEKY